MKKFETDDSTYSVHKRRMINLTVRFPSGSDFQKFAKNHTYPSSDWKLYNYTIKVFLKQVSYITVVFKNLENIALV